MRVGLVADTHVPEAGADLPAAAYRALAGCEAILHAGDLHTLDVVDRLERIAPTVVSRGNGDTAGPRVRRPGVPDDPRVRDVVVRTVGPFRVGMTHDLEHTEHRPDEEVGPLLLRAFGEPVDVAVYGHTHVPAVRGLAGGTALVNPGSPTMPYGYPGLVGTLALLDVAGSRFTVTVLDLATGTPQLRLCGPRPAPLSVGPRPSGGR